MNVHDFNGHLLADEPSPGVSKIVDDLLEDVPTALQLNILVDLLSDLMPRFAGLVGREQACDFLVGAGEALRAPPRGDRQ